MVGAKRKWTMDALAVDPTERKNTSDKFCENCGRQFAPREGSGGKPQRFCSPDCRQAFHLKPQRGQRSPTYSALPTIVAPEATKSSTSSVGASYEEFDWEDADAIVLDAQAETAVYWNRRGELVIRQRHWPDDDSFILISRTNVSDFIDKLTDVVGIPSVGR
jgi:hypothetical protein